MAYTEFTLSDNSPETRRKFEAAIEIVPEFMDCLRLSGDTDYISFTCCTNVAELNRLCDEMSANSAIEDTEDRDPPDSGATKVLPGLPHRQAEMARLGRFVQLTKV